MILTAQAIGVIISVVSCRYIFTTGSICNLKIPIITLGGYSRCSGLLRCCGSLGGLPGCFCCCRRGGSLFSTVSPIITGACGSQELPTSPERGDQEASAEWQPQTVAHQAPCPGDFSGRNTGMGCHFLPQAFFPTQGLNPHHLCLLVLASGIFTTSDTWESRRDPDTKN